MTVESQQCLEPVRFASVVVLSKQEAFEACEVCADAELALLRGGHAVQASQAAALFELFESRLLIE
jgi:hypothetical protein